jgi:hydroxyacylglutathione hydrolase
MAIPLEDNFTDIIGKAQRGLKISDSQLAAKAGVSAEEVRRARGGEIDEKVLRALAPALELDANALLDSAQEKWKPEVIASFAGLAQFQTQWHDMAVNSYLIWDPASREAAAFDSGGDASEMLRRIEREKLSVKIILLTHAHGDHIADLDRLQKETGAPTYLSELEAAPEAEPIREGKKFTVGGLQIEALLTRGHSPGGMTFLVAGLPRPIAVVGDSLFAGSMGGGNVSYEDALRNNVEKILALPANTILCPGHGPLTSVGEEQRHNPFFAARFHS